MIDESERLYALDCLRGDSLKEVFKSQNRAVLKAKFSSGEMEITDKDIEKAKLHFLSKVYNNQKAGEQFLETLRKREKLDNWMDLSKKDLATIYYIDAYFNSLAKESFIYSFKLKDFEKDSKEQMIESLKELFKNKPYYLDALISKFGSKLWSEVEHKLKPLFIFFEDKDHLCLYYVGIGDLEKLYDIKKQEYVEINGPISVFVRLHLDQLIAEFTIVSGNDKFSEIERTIIEIQSAFNNKLNTFTKIHLQESNLREFYNKAQRRTLFSKEGNVSVTFRASDKLSDAKNDPANDPNMENRDFHKVNGEIVIKLASGNLQATFGLLVNQPKIKLFTYVQPADRLRVLHTLLKNIGV